MGQAVLDGSGRLISDSRTENRTPHTGTLATDLGTKESMQNPRSFLLLAAASPS